MSAVKRTDKGARIMGLLATDPGHPEVREIIQHMRDTVTGAEYLSDDDIIEITLLVLGDAVPAPAN